jgi:tetratricopeptide (TPR) repeat protein
MTPLPISKSINLPQTIQRALDLHRQGQLLQAEKLYGDVLAVRPDYFEALHMLGLIKMQRGDLAGALALMAAAMRARPNSPEVLINYGLVLNGLGRNEEALAAFDQALAFKRRSVEAHNNRGAVLEQLGRNEEALEAIHCALAIKPNHVDSHYNKGSILRKLGRHEEALECFDRTLRLKPDYVRAHNNRGVTLEALGDADEAIASYDRALALDPKFGDALNNRANALQRAGRHEEALASYDRALEVNPSHAEVLNNRGSALAALGRYAEALESCIRSTTINPLYANAQWNESLLRLRMGDFAGGWEKYEWRWKRPEGLKKVRTLSKPRWYGDEPVAGKTVLLYVEQGFGDTIQFARYAKLLVERGAKVILEVQPVLKSLLLNLGDGINVIAIGEDLPPFDLQCPLLSAPLAFRTDLTSIPADVPYLSVPDERVEQWSNRLPPRQGIRAGIVWSGNATHADDQNRSIALSRLAPLFDVPGFQFVSLQKGVRDADAEILAADPRIADLARHIDDFSDTAAAVAAVDLVISVDTSVAHLAGALGKPVWVLLPFCPDWRWLLDRSDSPWYPSARLFRQPRMRDWDSVIEEVQQALLQRAGHEPRPGAAVRDR